MKLLVAIVAGWCLGALASPAAGNRDRSFDSDWRFLRADAPSAEAPGFDDSAWRTLDVPHDWSIEDLPPREISVPELPVVTGQWRFQKGDDVAWKARDLDDIVSKNGNLMLSVPLRRDGQPDEQEIEIVKEIGAWLKVNGEAIYATRPWKIYGEGPSTQAAEKGQFDGQKDVSDKPFTAEDIRFTQSKDGKTVYAIVLEIPKDGKVTVKSLAAGPEQWPGKIGSVRLVGGGKLKFTRDENGLHISLPEKFDGKTALALKVRS
jgi:Alpha-L-fucosidase C-terminal domain/Alpha-L-fucosidase